MDTNQIEQELNKMITKEQAINASEFHADGCVKIVGPRGGETIKVEVWRRNGATKLWKTRPSKFQIPIKRGLRYYAYITESNANHVHLPEDCPIA